MKKIFIYILLFLILAVPKRNIATTTEITDKSPKAKGSANDKYSLNPNVSPYNVVFIQLDELSIKYLGAYGNKLIKTPNIDRLAAEGVLFENSYCATPYCSPTRASFVTGQWPSKNGIVYNVGNVEGLMGNETIADQIIYQNGYAVEHFGKWHIGDKRAFECYENSAYTKNYVEKFAKPYTTDPAPEGYVLRNGVYLTQHNYDVLEKALSDKYGPAQLLNIGRQAQPVENDVWMGLASETANYIDKNKDSRFMLTTSLHPPHSPYYVPEPYYSMYDQNTIPLSDSYFFNDHPYTSADPYLQGQMLGEEGVREYIRVIYGMVTMMDDTVGRILDALERNGLRENTLIVFTSDHGQFNGNHGGMIGKVVNAMYDEFTQVPLIVSMPSVIPQGVKVKSYANSVDIPVTILDYLNIPIPTSMQGRTLKPILTNGVDPENLGVGMCQQPGGRMIANGEYKYNYYFESGKVREELFSIANDPDEINNLANNPEYAQTKTQMKALLNENLVKIQDMNTDELLSTGGPKGNLSRPVVGKPEWQYD